MKNVKIEKFDKGLKVCKFALALAMLAFGVFIWLSTSVSFAEIDTEAWNEFIGQFIAIYNTIVMPTLTTVAGAILIISGVFNFLKFKQASDDGEREKAKKAVLWWIISVVGSIAVLWITPNLIGLAKGWFTSAGLATPT